MYSEWGWLLILAVFVWLGGLSFLTWQQQRFFKSLFPKSGERDIRKKFEETVGQVLGFRQNLDQISKKIVEVEGLGLKHIQKVELSRYNPYDETGGDQSFSLALLDNKGNGVVLTSLHSRSGTRVFAKPVVLGKSTKHRFSEEEEQVVNKVMER